MPYTIVAFTDAHLSELVDLWVAAWMKAMPSIDFEQRRAWLVPRLRALQDAGANIVCLFDGQGDMAGFATLDPATAEIDQLAVSPVHWGQRRGRRANG